MFIQKEARVSATLLIPLFQAFALPLIQNKQCRSPRILVYRSILYAKPVDEEHCVIAESGLEVAKFETAADKRCYTSL